MNVSTLAIPKDVAAQKAEEYAELSGKQRNKEDDALAHLYKSRSYAVERKINNLRAFLRKVNCNKSFIFNKVVFNNVSTA